MRPSEKALRKAAAVESRRIEGMDAESASLLFQTVEQRRQTYDEMMWQVPALGLTAQAFLLTIALGGESSWTARALAAALGIAAASAGAQLLLKHRYHEELFSNWLQAFAHLRGWPQPNSPLEVEGFAYDGPHRWQRADSRGLARWIGIARRRAIRFRSAYVWLSALLMFGVVDVGVLVLCALHWLGRA